jgi:hypothetical protein
MSPAARAARANVAHARGREARTGWRRSHRLERERPDQYEAKDEPAMHVRPCSHERSEPERRRAAAIAYGDERGAPGGGERERQDMGPRKQVRRQKRKPNRDGRDERDTAKFARRVHSDDQRRDCDGGAGQHHDAAPSAETKGKRQKDFR